MNEAAKLQFLRFLLFATLACTGMSSLQANPASKPPNDDFENAAELPPFAIRESVLFDSRGGTLQPGEYFHSNYGTPQASLWWKWVPRHNVPTKVYPEAGRLFVFEGENLSGLRKLFEANPVRQFNLPTGSITTGPAEFNSVAGHTYWFALATTNFGPGQWYLEQQLHSLSSPLRDQPGRVGHPANIAISGVPDVPPPENITIKVRERRYSPTVPGGTFLTLAETNLSSSQSSWQWTPSAIGVVSIYAEGKYPLGQSWSDEFTATLLETVANDSFRAPAIVPPDVVETNLLFSTTWATVETGEPPAGENMLARTLWWQWSPLTNLSVRLHVAGPLGGLPIDLFNETNGSLARIAHNDGHAFAASWLGAVLIDLKAGESYFIRVMDTWPDFYWDNIYNRFRPTDRSAYWLRIELAGRPLSGIASSNVFWIPRPASPHFGFGMGYYWVYSIEELTSLPRGSPMDRFPAENWQVRVWDGRMGATYEAARARGGLFGRSDVRERRNDRESDLDIPEIRLVTEAQPFIPGALQISKASPPQPTSILHTGPRGYLTLLEASTTAVEWTPLLLLTNVSGSLLFTDPRTNPPPTSLYRTRLID